MKIKKHKFQSRNNRWVFGIDKFRIEIVAENLRSWGCWKNKYFRTKNRQNYWPRKPMILRKRVWKINLVSNQVVFFMKKKLVSAFRFVMKFRIFNYFYSFKNSKLLFHQIIANIKNLHIVDWFSRFDSW